MNCKGKNDLEHQITITINSIDKNKKRRINAFDTVRIRVESIGYLKKRFTKVGEYITDSTGSVNIKIDSSKIYMIAITGWKVLGLEMYYPGDLKNRHEVNVELFSVD